MIVPILEDDRECGTLCTERKGLYMVFLAELDTDSLCRVFAVFESGEIPLGVPAPENGKMRLCVSIPVSRLPKGNLLRGKLRPSSNEWARFAGGNVGSFVFPPGWRRGSTYRFRWEGGDRFPCDELLCFFQLVHEQEYTCLEIHLDENGHPVV